MLSVIIVAAGSSQRMGFDKLFAPLAGTSVIAQTVSAFDQTACVDEIILVGREGGLTNLQELVKQTGARKVRHIVPGGKHRQDSGLSGLCYGAAQAEHVAVHDAARPLITSV